MASFNRQKGEKQMNQQKVKMMRRQQTDAGVEFQVFGDIKDMPDVVCSKCMGKTFVSAVQMKKVPGLANSSGRTKYVPKPVLVCVNSECGAILEDHP
jgi:hypothetical protein